MKGLISLPFLVLTFQESMCLIHMWFRWIEDLKIDIYEGEEALELKAHRWDIIASLDQLCF